MPIFEYKCEKCGATSEFIVFGAGEKLLCKSCGSPELTKLLSAHNTVGSSSGFPKTDGGGCCGSPNSCGMPGSCCSG